MCITEKISVENKITDNIHAYILSTEDLRLDDVYILGTLVATDKNNSENVKKTTFEYNTDVGDLLLHSYSESGWITGSCYEVEPDAVFTDYSNIRIVADFIEFAAENFAKSIV